MHLQNARLPATISRIADVAHIEVTGSEHLDSTPARLDMDGVPVAEALLRLTAGYTSTFEYHGTRLARVSIEPEPAQSSSDSQQSSAEWATQFDQLAPQQRGDALEAIAIHGGDGMHEAITHALSDADEGVRLRALEQTQVVKGLALSTDSLQTMLLQDASETVRLKALDVLATDPGIDADTLAGIASKAESDSSEQVRIAAAMLRQRLQDERAPPPKADSLVAMPGEVD
jgi:hypothetical protein